MPTATCPSSQHLVQAVLSLKTDLESEVAASALRQHVPDKRDFFSHDRLGLGELAKDLPQAASQRRVTEKRRDFAIIEIAQSLASNHALNGPPRIVFAQGGVDLVHAR